MTDPAISVDRFENEWLAFAEMRLKALLSAELFLEGAGIDKPLQSAVSEQCHLRWVDLANAFAVLPRSVEILSIIANDGKANDRSLRLGFLTIGRGASSEEASTRCRADFVNVKKLLRNILDYAEMETVTELEEVQSQVAQIRFADAVELRRRVESLTVGDGLIVTSGVGFSESPGRRVKGGAEVTLQHLFPWVPSDDNWSRLLEAFRREPSGAALVIHLKGWARAPEDCLALARKNLMRSEKVVGLNLEERVRTIFHLQAQILRKDALRRVSILEGPVIAVRVFVTSQVSPSDALLSIVKSCLDDASVQIEDFKSNTLFRGGASISAANPGAVFAPLENPTIELLFGPRETASVFRTPMPSQVEMAGLKINRARTAALTGMSGSDSPLGNNVHRGFKTPVSLDSSMRFRHTYIIGQTGTGKSSLMLHMILHDIRAGRGIAVLDPHGTLIEQVLLHYPEERSDDVVLVDVTDLDRPVGFNPLRIMESDPLQYRLARDLIIDDLYGYLDRVYNMREVGGPMFEAHFRGFLGLLLGVEPQLVNQVPNLLVFRLLYTNRELREALVAKIKEKDLLIESFVTEAIRTTGEQALENMAPYVTSKFGRFISDLGLRNITCQSQVLDLESVVNQGKVLLFYSGKGRFGDLAAGLLAGQLVSRLRHIVMKRGISARNRPFYLYADEFQLFADRKFSELLAEARKFKFALTLAHQYVGQLPEEVLNGVLGNVGTTIVFRVGALDGKALEPLFQPFFGQRDVTSQPNFRAYVRSFGTLGQTPFSIEIPPPLGGGDQDLAARIREQSRQKYGRPRLEVEEEIRATYEAFNRVLREGVQS